ncbi:Signal transduction histidine kinase [Azotobacter beijerinckii]|uniref:histidine kinase n=1 Tax=Azotobacter beijerinckii TaxID=170623 RepID=A0A1H9LLV5_9GAMM|nr:ATP-binding protein [Azotobacter beijerinckii]SER12400.1 Signal transduction histidine kinase [Azotobacter beijerinckii]
MRSIRARTLALVLGVLSLSLPLITYKSYRDAQHEIEELFDAQLAQTARMLAGLVGRGMAEREREEVQAMLDEALGLQFLPGGHGALSLGHRYEGKLAFQVFDEQGRLLLHSASAAHTLFSGLLAEVPAALADERLVGYHLLETEPFRWRVFALHDRIDRRWILVGEREDVRGELAGKIAQRSLLPDLVGLPLLALLVWLAIGCGLTPLERMVGLIRARDPNNLAPLLLAPLPRELEPVMAALNRLLLQVTQLLERERQLLAAAAHELRTPLAVLRIHAQNALEAPDPADRDEALRQLGPGVERATRVVGQLLALARLEPAAVQLNMIPLDLAVLLRDELAELTPLALAKRQELTLETSGAGGYELRGDAPSLAILVQNLVANAVQYTPDGGRVRLQLEAAADSLLLRVQDSGPGIPPALREKVFERFFREGGGQGAGLGLSIVRRAVELHGGEIALGESPLGGLEVSVYLPR